MSPTELSDSTRRMNVEKRPTKSISCTKVIVSASILSLGILCGLLNCIGNGTGAIMLVKDQNPLAWIAGGVLLVSSMPGHAASVLASILAGEGGFNPFLFWLGQLAFYSFVSISILRSRRPDRSGLKPDSEPSAGGENSGDTAEAARDDD